MKKQFIALFFLIAIAFAVRCSIPQDSHKDRVTIEATRGDVQMTKMVYENHEYLIFRGSDYFSAVVHSASCSYCDSIKKGQ